MGVKLRTRRGKVGKVVTYYLDISNAGQRWTSTLKIDPSLKESERKRIAEIKRAEREKQIFYTDEFTVHQHTNFYEYMDRYLQGYDKKDYKKIKHACAVFKEHFGRSLMTNHITRDGMQGFADMLSQRYNGGTPRTIYQSISKIIKAARRDQVIQGNPIEFVKAPKVSGVQTKDILTAEEIDRMMEVMSLKLTEKAFIWCCYTGQTYPEVKNTVHSQISGDVLSYIRDKTSKEVKLKLHPRAMGVLSGMDVQAGRLVFPQLPSDVTAAKHIKAWVKRAEINKHITWYCARHTFATLLAESGATDLIISHLMGNSPEYVRQNYTTKVEQAKRDAIDRMM